MHFVGAALNHHFRTADNQLVLNQNFKTKLVWVNLHNFWKFTINTRIPAAPALLCMQLRAGCTIHSYACFVYFSNVTGLPATHARTRAKQWMCENWNLDPPLICTCSCNAWRMKQKVDMLAIASACILAAQPFSNMSKKGFDTCTATCKGSFETNPFEHLYGLSLDDKLQVVHVCTSIAVSPDPTSHGLEMGGDVSIEW